MEEQQNRSSRSGCITFIRHSPQNQRQSQWHATMWKESRLEDVAWHSKSEQYNIPRRLRKTIGVYSKRTYACRLFLMPDTEYVWKTEWYI